MYGIRNTVEKHCQRIRHAEIQEKLPLNQEAVYEKLTEIFHDLFDDDSIVVTPELTARDVEGWDSLAHIRLIITIEKAFKVKFSTTEIAKLEKVGDLAALIQSRA